MFLIPAYAFSGPENTQIITYICKSPTASITPWKNTVTRAIAFGLARPAGVKGQVRGEAECGEQTVEFACTGGVYDKGGPILICSADTLLLLLKVSAWYAIEHRLDPEEDYEVFRNRHEPRLGLVAFKAVSNSDLDDAFTMSLDSLRRQSEAGAVAVGQRRHVVFEGILNLVYAALIGHESAHIATAPPYCAITSQSRVEKTGLWAVLLRIAGSGELYKNQVPVVGELTADRCATRRIQVARGVLEKGTLSVNDQEFVRRAAADIISTMLFIRFDPAGRSPTITINDAYLYTPSRIVALAGELGIDGPGPVICGGAAENLTEATQFAMKQRPGNGLMPDEMEHVFPKGVIDAWERRSNWSPASYACR